MTERTRILLIDEDPEERELTAMVLLEKVPSVEIHQAGTGLDYALELARPGLQVAIASPSFSWADGREVLDRVRRHHPRCSTIMLGDEVSNRVASGQVDGTGFEFYRKSASGLAELARALRESFSAGRAPEPRETVGSHPSRTVVPDAYDHLWTELRSVHALGEQIVRDDLLGPHPKQVVTTFLRATERLESTVAFLLGDGTESELELVPVSVADAVLVAMRGLQPALQAARARVLAGRLPVLFADRGSLVTLFHHLIDNAIKFRAERSPEITVRAQRDGDYWQLLVEDNGIGVDSAVAASIFEMFQRGPGTEHLPGTGIGLAICRRIAKRYQGAIRCHANTAGGTTFSVSLRVREVEPRIVDLTVQCNGREVGHIRTQSNADKNAITREALGLPALNRAIGEQTIKDVQLLENRVVNILV